MTWAMMKDTTKKRLIPNTDLISIRDFYPTIMEKAGLKFEDPIIKTECRSVSSQLDTERIFYIEDGRSHIDLQNSTSVAALKFDKWNGIENDYQYSQVTLYRHLADIVTKKGDSYNTDILETLVRSRFKWI